MLDYVIKIGEKVNIHSYPNISGSGTPININLMIHLLFILTKTLTLFPAIVAFKA